MEFQTIFRKPIIKVLAFSILIKLPICFMIYSYLDIPRYTEVGASLLYGINPYSTGIEYSNYPFSAIPYEFFPYPYYNKYPPLFFTFRVFGFCYLGIRFLVCGCYFCFLIVCAFILCIKLGSCYLVKMLG